MKRNVEFPRQRRSSQVITVQFGHCGNKIGSKFWEVISDEHRINRDGIRTRSRTSDLERINVYFKETEDQKYVPRAVLVDTDPSTLDSIRLTAIGKCFKQDNFLCGSESAANNWATAFCGEGMMLADQVVDIVRKEAESTDYLQGVHLIHSMGGGTGSGLGSHIITKLRDAFPLRIMSSFSVFPSLKLPHAIFEPYNVILAMADFIEHGDEVICVDNDALRRFYWRAMGNTWPIYDDLNRHVSMMLSGVTSVVRFYGRLSLDLYKMAANMIPYRGYHFLAPAFVTLNPQNIEGKIGRGPLQALIKRLFDVRNLMVTCNPYRGRYLGATAMFRGPIDMRDVEETILLARNSAISSRTIFVPDNIRWDVCKVPTRGTKISGTFVGNTTAIRELFIRINKRFREMFRYKAYLHLYRAEGIDEDNFNEAADTLENMIDNYRHL